MQITGWEFWLAMGLGVALAIWSDARKARRKHQPFPQTPMMRGLLLGVGIVWLIIFAILLGRTPGVGWRNDFLTFIPLVLHKTAPKRDLVEMPTYS